VSALPEPRAALRRLARRRLVRLARAAGAESGVAFLVVGGAVRDALLGLPPGDLDLAVRREGALAFAGALARLGGSRAVAIGRTPRRILHVPLGRSSVDVWETDRDPADDLDRRDFTVNALGLGFPGARLVATEAALEDLRARRLRLPRAGVLLEDPLRVVRAARFLERLPAFRLDPAALPELRLAARRLDGVSPERRLGELDAILEAGPRAAARALSRLEEWGALGPLLPGVQESARRRGIVLVRRTDADASVGLLRTFLLCPAGPEAASSALDALRASRRDHRLAETLLTLARPARNPSRRDAILLLRLAAPFSREAIEFVATAHGVRGRALAREAREVLSARGGLERVLRPRRPLDAEAVALVTGASGSALGSVLAKLDEALATGEVRGQRQARAFLAARTAQSGPASRRRAGTV
jgi:poly(A) polymerase